MMLRLIVMLQGCKKSFDEMNPNAELRRIDRDG